MQVSATKSKPEAFERANVLQAKADYEAKRQNTPALRSLWAACEELLRAYPQWSEYTSVEFIEALRLYEITPEGHEPYSFRNIFLLRVSQADEFHKDKRFRVQNSFLVQGRYRPYLYGKAAEGVEAGPVPLRGTEQVRRPLYRALEVVFIESRKPRGVKQDPNAGGATFYEYAARMSQRARDALEALVSVFSNDLKTGGRVKMGVLRSWVIEALKDEGHSEDAAAAAYTEMLEHAEVWVEGACA